MAGLAPGRSRDAARTVGAMARLAASRDGRVRAGGLVRVTGRASREGLPCMRLVTADAALVAGGRRLLLGGVAGAARHRRRWRMGHLRAMTGPAIGVTRVCRDECGLARVAIPAKGLLAQPREVMRLVAPLARDASGVGGGIEHGDLRVAARARDRDDRGVIAVRGVAGAAGFLGSMFDLDVLVAADARGRSPGRIMRRVAACTDRVGRRHVRGQRRLLAVAADASLLATRHEVVGLMATDARVVTRRMRPRGLSVARRACNRGGCRRPVRAVTVETPLRAGVLAVLRRALVVAARTISRDDGRSRRADGGTSRTQPWRAARRRTGRPPASRGSRCRSARADPARTGGTSNRRSRRVPDRPGVLSQTP